MLRISATILLFAALSPLLSGCLAYDAASTVVDAGATVVGAGASAVGTVGDVVTSPFDGAAKAKAR